MGCGEAAPSRGHGLTRLRRWPTALERPKRGGFMGPYAEEMLENWEMLAERMRLVIFIIERLQLQYLISTSILHHIIFI